MEGYWDLAQAIINLGKRWWVSG